MSNSAEQSPVGLRYDEGKIRFDLIPREWEFGLAHLLTQGAKKYAPNNWKKGMAWSKVLASLRRHLDRWLSGENYDEETGAHHLLAVAWNALVLMSYQLRGVGEQDIDRVTVPYLKEDFIVTKT